MFPVLSLLLLKLPQYLILYDMAIAPFLSIACVPEKIDGDQSLPFRRL